MVARSLWEVRQETERSQSGRMSAVQHPYAKCLTGAKKVLRVQADRLTELWREEKKKIKALTCSFPLMHS